MAGGIFAHESPAKIGERLTERARFLTLSHVASSRSDLFVQHGRQRSWQHRRDFILSSEEHQMASTGRFRGTDRLGRPFSRGVIKRVWAKVGGGYSDFAEDVCGAKIRESDYGELSRYGWEIDHIHPVKLGGSDNLDNLQPLHWENNRSKADRTDSSDAWCVVR